MTDLLLTDGQAEYMGIGGNGERLLLKEEWYWPDPVFVAWSRSPISTVLFRIAGDRSSGSALAWSSTGVPGQRGVYELSLTITLCGQERLTRRRPLS